MQRTGLLLVNNQVVWKAWNGCLHLQTDLCEVLDMDIGLGRQSIDASYIGASRLETIEFQSTSLTSENRIGRNILHPTIYQNAATTVFSNATRKKDAALLD